MENNTNQLKKYGNRATPPPTISLNDAIARTSQWRDVLQSIPAVTDDAATQNTGFEGAIPDNLLFRAINIRMEDIQYLWGMHPDAVAVRLYMSVIDPDTPYHITGVLVPVDAQNRDILTTDVDSALSDEEIMASTTASSIYDFTQPCPTVCNTGSPLFNQSNSPAPYFRYKK